MNLKTLTGMALAAGIAAGCVSTPDRVSGTMDVSGPAIERVDDPNPFANYDQGMASDPDHPMAYEWQRYHGQEIDRLTRPEVLKNFVRDKESAEKLIRSLRSGYATDPILMIQIGAVTQWVMDPGNPNAAGDRAIWREAIWSAFFRDTGYNPYHAMFLLDQLRWCGDVEDARRLRDVAKSWGTRCIVRRIDDHSCEAKPRPLTKSEELDARHVREFAVLVEREIAK